MFLSLFPLLPSSTTQPLLIYFIRIHLKTPMSTKYFKYKLHRDANYYPLFHPYETFFKNNMTKRKMHKMHKNLEVMGEK